jgi:hypothetical protein
VRVLRGVSVSVGIVLAGAAVALAPALIRLWRVLEADGWRWDY